MLTMAVGDSLCRTGTVQANQAECAERRPSASCLRPPRGGLGLS